MPLLSVVSNVIKCIRDNRVKTSALFYFYFFVCSDAVQESHLGLMGIATFMGLQCSEEQAFKVWQSRRKGTRSSDYTNHGLPEQTVEWMTDIMAKLLPPLLALRWGAILTDDPPRD